MSLTMMKKKKKQDHDIIDRFAYAFVSVPKGLSEEMTTFLAQELEERKLAMQMVQMPILFPMMWMQSTSEMRQPIIEITIPTITTPITTTQLRISKLSVRSNKESPPYVMDAMQINPGKRCVMVGKNNIWSKELSYEEFDRQTGPENLAQYIALANHLADKQIIAAGGTRSVMHVKKRIKGVQTRPILIKVM